MDEQLTGYMKEAERLTQLGLGKANPMATQQLAAAQVYSTMAVSCALEKMREENKGSKK